MEVKIPKAALIHEKIMLGGGIHFIQKSGTKKKKKGMNRKQIQNESLKLNNVQNYLLLLASVRPQYPSEN